MGVPGAWSRVTGWSDWLKTMLKHKKLIMLPKLDISPGLLQALLFELQKRVWPGVVQDERVVGES